MLCDVSTNLPEFINPNPDAVVFVSNNPTCDPPKKKVRNDSQLLVRSQSGNFTVNPEHFVWLELSLVPEVERVFVTRRSNDFKVLAVVNQRDPQLRAKIYEREKAIIDALPGHEFDFHVLARMDRDLGDIFDQADKPAYVRR